MPNHPRWPLVVYRNSVKLPDDLDHAAVFEDLFEKNGWSDSWRDGVYDYLHFHSRVHEVMGVARGTASVQFGGVRSRKLTVKAGDVLVLPAGTGHQCFSASKDFLVVGAYPASGTYDVCRATAKAHEHALKTVPKVIPPPSRSHLRQKRTASHSLEEGAEADEAPAAMNHLGKSIERLRPLVLLPLGSERPRAISKQKPPSRVQLLPWGPGQPILLECCRSSGRTCGDSVPRPSPIPPMEAQSVSEIPEGKNWIYEPKWDGFRCLLFRDGDFVALQSKSGRPLDRYFPEIVAAAHRVPVHQFVVDGELAVSVKGTFSFDDLLQRIHPAQSRIRTLALQTPALMIVFDLLSIDGQAPLASRCENVERRLRNSRGEHSAIKKLFDSLRRRTASQLQRSG